MKNSNNAPLEGKHRDLSTIHENRREKIESNEKLKFYNTSNAFKEAY